MATRLYMNGVTTGPQFYLNPFSYGAQWESTASPDVTGRLFRSRGGSAFYQFNRNKSGFPNVTDRLLAVVVSNQLTAQTITGTAKAVLRVREDVVLADIRSQMAIRVMSADLQTERGVLYAGDDGALSKEWATVLTNRYFPQSGSATLSSVNAQDGDRIQVEIGFRSHSIGDSSGTGYIELGDAAVDLADDETNTTQGAPWVEFSQDIVFKDYPHGATLYSQSFTDTDGDPWPAEFATSTIGVDSVIDINTNAGRHKVGIASDSDSARAILDVGTLDVADADVYLRFRFDSLEPVSQSHSDPVVCLVWLRGDGTWNVASGNTERPDENGVGFEWWNNRPGVKIVEIFNGTSGHPSADLECRIRPEPLNTSETWVRMRVEGTYGAMKMWQGDIVDEPLDWQVESHAVQVFGPGQFQIACKRDNGNGTVITSMFVDDLDIGDAVGDPESVTAMVGAARSGALI